MNTTKKALSVFLSVVMLLGVLPAVSFAAGIVASGSCGENVTWTLDDEGTLVISGEGPMTDYAEGESPFSANEAIKNAVISSGVTGIGKTAFEGCSALASVTIPESVKRIGDSAFSKCTALTSVTLPEGVTSIGNYAF